MPRPKGPFIAGRKFKDLIEHEKHLAFLKARAQANFRQEGWLMTLEEFFEIWRDDLWANRGRGADKYCMVRVDVEKPWAIDNCIIVLRYQQLVRNKRPRIHPKLGFPKL